MRRKSRKALSPARLGVACAGALVVVGAMAVLAGEGNLPVPAAIRQSLMDAGWSSASVVEWQAQQATAAFGRESQEQAVAVNRSLVRRDPANPYRWCDLAESLEVIGDSEGASRAFREARLLGPAIPPVLIRAANFYFAKGDRAAAVETYRSVLPLTHDYDGIVFLTLRRLGLSVGEVTDNVIPRNPLTAGGYLASVMNAGDVAGASTVWQWMTAGGMTSDPAAASYVDFLLGKNEGAAAALVWAQYAGTRRGDYLAPNFVFNGAFASQPSGSRLDWHLEPLEGVETEIVERGERQAGRALEIRFGGRTNVNYHHVWQTVALPAGGFRIRARVKSTELTTNKGVQLHLTDPANHRFDWLSEPVLGTHDWFWLEANVVVPSCPFLLLEIIRQPSEKFDNQIGGTIQFEDISIARTGAAPASS